MEKEGQPEEGVVRRSQAHSLQGAVGNRDLFPPVLTAGSRRTEPAQVGSAQLGVFEAREIVIPHSIWGCFVSLAARYSGHCDSVFAVAAAHHHIQHGYIAGMLS